MTDARPTSTSGATGEENEGLEDVVTAQRLVEVLRVQTDASHNDCNRAVVELLRNLAGHSKLSNVAEPIQSIIAAVQLDTIDPTGCVDGQQLTVALTSLSEHKNDAQERSWQLHESVDEIVQLLAQKLSDPRVSLAILPMDDFTHLLDLVFFFQMETRLAIKTALARALCAACRVNPLFVDVLLASVLPVELAATLMDSQFKKNELSSECFKLLVLLFCTGAQPPFDHYDTFNVDYVRRLVALVETDAWCAELAMNLLLAFNVHQRQIDNNYCVEVLCDRTTSSSGARVLERVLILFNEDEDPSWCFGDVDRESASHRFTHTENQTQCSNETTTAGCFIDGPRQLLTDLFISPKAAHLSDILYTNDAHVLFDVLLRRCYDLPVGMLRTVHLELLAAAARAMADGVAYDRKFEILECVTSIDFGSDEHGCDLIRLDRDAVKKIEGVFGDELVTNV